MSWYIALQDPWRRLELPAPLTVANDETGEIIVRGSFHDVYEQTQEDGRLLGRIARALGPSVLRRWEDGDESLDLAAEVAALRAAPYAGPVQPSSGQRDHHLGTRSNLDLRQVRAIVTDAEVLGGLDPTAVAAYLTRAGWARSSRGPRTGAVWSRELGAGRAAAVFLPNDQSAADFAIRMGELLTMLSRAEDRSQLAVLVDLYAGQAGTDDDHTGETRP